MQSSLVSHLGVVFGALGAVLGVAFREPPGGVLWPFGGYFFGMSVRTFASGRTA